MKSGLWSLFFYDCEVQIVDVFAESQLNKFDRFYNFILLLLWLVAPFGLLGYFYNV